MRSGLLFLFLLVGLPLFSSVEGVVRKVWAHLLIHDHEQAYREAKQCWEASPTSQLAFETYLHCMAVHKDERLWYEEWQKYKELYPEAAYEVKVLERVAWEVLERAKRSSSGQVRQLGLIAAALTRDVRAIPVIFEGLQDGNASIRELAVELCA